MYRQQSPHVTYLITTSLALLETWKTLIIPSTAITCFYIDKELYIIEKDLILLFKTRESNYRLDFNASLQMASAIKDIRCTTHNISVNHDAVASVIYDISKTFYSS